MLDQFQIVLDSLRDFWIDGSQLLPRLLAAFLILTAGWIVAKFIRKGVIKLMHLLRLDSVAEKSGIEDFLLKGGVKFTAVTIVGNLIYWFIMFTLTLAVLNSLGLHLAAEQFNRVIQYIPIVVVAMILIIFGGLFAKVVEGMSYAYFSNIGISGAKAMSKIAQFAILIFVISVALEQLAIGGAILVSAFQIAFGALCLALALAFGIGGKEWAAKILDKSWKK